MSQEKDVSYNWQNIIFECRTDAEDVLSHMTDLIKNYGRASIADLCNLVGISSANDDRQCGWYNLSGWYDLKSAYVQPVDKGYNISLPEPVAFN